MSYTAHMTDTVYRYDGSFPGFLCCIFESYAKKELPAAVLPPEEEQLSLFGSRDIPTDMARASRVAAGLARLGGEVRKWVYSGFLSCQSGKELILLRLARRCFEQGPGVLSMLGDEEVAAAFRLMRRVRSEAAVFLELIRFEQRGSMLGAVIHPENQVLPLLRAHFCSRLPDEDFLIFDATHGTALLRQRGRVQYLAMTHYEKGLSPEEQDWQVLWKRFFKALTIEERRNEKLQMSHVPKRYWRDLCEMQLDRGEEQQKILENPRQVPANVV